MIEINALSRRVYVDGVEVDLGKYQFRMLVYFATHPDKLFDRQYLLDKVWGPDIMITEQSVNGHICAIRRQLGKYRRLIKSIQGEGYRLEPNVCEVRVITKEEK